MAVHLCFLCPGSEEEEGGLGDDGDHQGGHPGDPAQWGGVECGVVWCGVVWCGVVWCGVVWVSFQGYITQVFKMMEKMLILRSSTNNKVSLNDRKKM